MPSKHLIPCWGSGWMFSYWQWWPLVTVFWSLSHSYYFKQWLSISTKVWDVVKTNKANWNFPTYCQPFLCICIIYNHYELWTLVWKRKAQSVSVFGTWFVNILLAWTVQIIQRQLKEQLYCSVVCACAQFREQICEVEVCPKWSRQLAVHTNGFWPPGRGLTAPGDWKIKREVSTYCLTTLCKIFSLWEKEIVCDVSLGRRIICLCSAKVYCPVELSTP